MDNQSSQPAREYSRQASRDHSKQHNGDINIHLGYASELQSELVAIHETLRSPDLSNVGLSTDAAQPRVPLGSPTSTPSNEHFSLPQPVERDYTGRTSILEDVRNAFNAPACSDQHQIQRRIVVYGVGGSGKTQFCCKYAQMYRQRSATSTLSSRLFAIADAIVKLLGYLLDQCKLRQISQADFPRYLQGREGR